MASSEQVKKFITEIAPLAQKAFLELGKIHPSICIGMACVESGYGTAGSCKYHSYLGQKVGTGKTATRYWNGSYFTSKTKEEYTVGVHTVISNAAFRSYPSMELCVFNYYELLNTNLYKRVTKTQYRAQMQQIKDCGYMTSSTEVNSVLNIIAKYNLDSQYYGELVDEAFSLKAFDTSKVIELFTGEENAYMILYRAAKSEEHFENYRQDIVDAYAQNEIGKMIYETASSINDKISYTGVELDHSAISME